MRKFNFILLFVAFIVLSVFFINTYFFSIQAKVKNNPTKTIPVKVETKKATKKSISETLSLTGEFFANESVSIQSEVSGRIDFIGFSDGQFVKKDTLLVGLDATLPLAQFLKDRAEYKLASSNLNRSRNLHEKNYLSPRALDEIIASEEISNAKMQLSKAILEQYKIKAPFDGKIGLRKISIGSYVQNGQELLKLQDLSIMKFDFQVPERFSNLVSVGQHLTIETNTFQNHIDGIVSAIDVGNQNKGRLLVLRTLVENQKGLLRSGMFGKVNLTIKKKDQTVVIAEEALFSEQSSKFVWLVENGVVKKIPVTVGLRLNKEVEIISGLSKGDTVVVAGHLKLRKDGQSVLAVNKN